MRNPHVWAMSRIQPGYFLGPTTVVNVNKNVGRANQNDVIYPSIYFYFSTRRRSRTRRKRKRGRYERCEHKTCPNRITCDEHGLLGPEVAEGITLSNVILDSEWIRNDDIWLFQSRYISRMVEIVNFRAIVSLYIGVMLHLSMNPAPQINVSNIQKIS